MKDQQTSSRKQTEHKEVAKAAARMARSGRPLQGNSASTRTRLDSAERRELIARVAYFRAERRGFAPGGELEDWLEAEAEVGRLLDS
jgi:Protein of unknown function (DUF2934)